MKRSAAANRDCITVSDDESSPTFPVKRVEIGSETNNPSREVHELQQKVARLEKDFQGACRVAMQRELALSEASERMEYLENLVDKKSVATDGVEKSLVDELQRKLAETSTQLEKERRETVSREGRMAKMEKDFQSACRLANEYEKGMKEAKERVAILENIIDQKSPVEEVQKKLAETSAQLEKERREAATRDGRMTKLEKDFQSAVRIASEYEKGMKEAKARVAYLENLIDKKPAVACDEEAKKQVEQVLKTFAEAASREEELKERIGELTRKLSKYESGGQQPVPPSPSPSVLAPPAMPQPPTPSVLPPIVPQHQPQQPPQSHSQNILQLFPKGSTLVIPFHKALIQLRPFFLLSDSGEWKQRCVDALKNETLICPVCDNQTFKHINIIFHLFSDDHKHKRTPTLNAVSRSALDYWKRKLNSVPK